MFTSMINPMEEEEDGLEIIEFTEVANLNKLKFP